jgi:hypothetical protein
MPHDRTYTSPAGGQTTDADPLADATRRWERAEAEAEADVMDADLESCGARELPAATVAARQTLTPVAAVSEADLAEAESVTDLSHVEDAA